MSKKKMTPEEIKQWNDLYYYIKYKILKYEDSKKLPNSLVLRLKGLAEGKFMANNNIKAHADYSFELILTTFKYCKLDILRAINSNVIKDESHMINYMMLLVENNINTVYDKLKNRQLANEKTKNTELNEGTKLKYKKKSSEITNSRLKDLI